MYDYLKWVDSCFLHEEMYCDSLLQPESRFKLLCSVENELIRKHCNLIVNKSTGVKYMLENDLKD